MGVCCWQYSWQYSWQDFEILKSWRIQFECGKRQPHSFAIIYHDFLPDMVAIELPYQNKGFIRRFLKETGFEARLDLHKFGSNCHTAQ